MSDLSWERMLEAYRERAERAESLLRAIVSNPNAGMQTANQDPDYCTLCPGERQSHDDTCPIAQARALLEVAA